MKNKKSKVGLWSALTAITAVLTDRGHRWQYHCKPVRHHHQRCSECIDLSDHSRQQQPPRDTEYFKKGFASDEEREAYEAELCAQVEAEGAALLKNQNDCPASGTAALRSACSATVPWT